MNEPGEVLFREEQRLMSLPVVWVTVAGMVALVGAGAAVAGAAAAALTLLPTLVVLGGVMLLLVLARLETEVRGDGLYVRYFPFHRSALAISLQDVKRIEARTYRPLLEYGGWGIRWTWKGKAYNAHGNRGVRIDYATGRHLLIGSQCPDELAGAIQTLLAEDAGTP